MKEKMTKNLIKRLKTIKKWYYKKMKKLYKMTKTNYEANEIERQI